MGQEEEEQRRWESLSQRLEALQEEALRLAGQVQQGLQEQPRGLVDLANGLTWTARWEQVESIAAALEVCQRLLAQDDPEEVRLLARQLRRWRRLEGQPGAGWIEVRPVNGYGPYVYHRWRNVERKIKTQYYGRFDRVQRWVKQALWNDGEAGQ